MVQFCLVDYFGKNKPFEDSSEEHCQGDGPSVCDVTRVLSLFRDGCDDRMVPSGGSNFPLHAYAYRRVRQIIVVGAFVSIIRALLSMPSFPGQRLG